jgi:hypothetical protein
MVGSFTRAHFAGVCVGGLTLLLLWYIPNMVELQAADCHLAPDFSDLLSKYVPPGPFRDDLDNFIRKFHEASASFIWMQLAVVLAYLVNWEMGAELYRVVILGHIIKNFSKSFIGSPRGFWFCKTGAALYCGTGERSY